jgi:GNAT superfamily N-acetyltransferase
MSTEVTPATREDVPHLCDLLSLLFAQEAEFHPDVNAQEKGLRAISDFPECGQILVLRNNGEVLGMVTMLFTVSTALGGRVALLEDMVVLPEQRGKGGGSQLLEAAIAFAKSAGCLRVTLLTDRANESAQKFYLRHGFSISEMLPLRRLL